MLTAQLTYEWRMVEFFFLTVENETDRKNETTKRRNELIEKRMKRSTEKKIAYS